MPDFVWRGALAAALIFCAASTQAQPAPPVAASESLPDPVLDARVQAIATELRCLVCQNQTIAESHAGLAVDLRRQVREMLQRGDTEKQVIDYMTARYGDFVLYRPPVRSSTALLWYGPAVLLLLAAVALVVMLRRRARMPADRFEPDPEDGATGSRVDPRTRPADPGSDETPR